MITIISIYFIIGNFYLDTFCQMGWHICVGDNLKLMAVVYVT
jgi:hypothetical protein